MSSVHSGKPSGCVFYFSTNFIKCQIMSPLNLRQGWAEHNQYQGVLVATPAGGQERETIWFSEDIYWCVCARLWQATKREGGYNFWSHIYCSPFDRPSLFALTHPSALQQSVLFSHQNLLPRLSHHHPPAKDLWKAQFSRTVCSEGKTERDSGEGERVREGGTGKRGGSTFTRVYKRRISIDMGWFVLRWQQRRWEEEDGRIKSSARKKPGWKREKSHKIFSINHCFPVPEWKQQATASSSSNGRSNLPNHHIVTSGEPTRSGLRVFWSVPVTSSSGFREYK